MMYSISELEQLSGIQSHTIRIWEQRYNALKPMRTEGNTRLYDDEQLKKLLDIVSLNQSGLKISKICSLTSTDLEHLLNKELNLSPQRSKFEYYVTQLLQFGLAYNEYDFDKLLTSCIEKFGILDSYRNILYPILVRLGLMWRQDHICPAQEHFLTNIIRRKIFTAIDSVPLQKAYEETWLLFLPEDEDHDIGLLFAHYLLKAVKKRVIFLGSKVPLSSIERVLDENKVDKLLLFMVRLRPKTAAQKYINDLQKITSAIKISLAGNAKVIDKLVLNENITRFSSLEEFENLIKNPLNV